MQISMVFLHPNNIESNVPRLAQDIHHRLVWQRAGETGNVLWEGRWMGQLAN